jgi:transcriptional regulator with XRE-family HTH domain
MMMKSWSDKKKELKSIDPVRMNELEELAEKVGLHQESIARIENGGSIPRLDTVFRLALALGMKISLHGREEAAASNIG